MLFGETEFLFQLEEYLTRERRIIESWLFRAERNRGYGANKKEKIEQMKRWKRGWGTPRFVNGELWGCA